MAQWAVVISPERYEAERLFHHETLPLDQPAHAPGGPLPAPGDEVLVVAARPEPVVVALGRVAGPMDQAATGQPTGAAPVTMAYTLRSFDAPVPAAGLCLDALNPDALSLVEPATFRALAGRLPPARDVRTWLVSVDLPIEAETPAEAVRRFWSYVRDLGPRELPTFVSPTDDELAMQAFVLGEQANLDPEEDED
jgi:hypothetical protein